MTSINSLSNAVDAVRGRLESMLQLTLPMPKEGEGGGVEPTPSCFS